MPDNRGFSEAPIRWMEAIREGLPVETVDDVWAVEDWARSRARELIGKGRQ